MTRAALFVEKILGQAQDDVPAEDFRMRRVSVLLRVYLVARQICFLFAVVATKTEQAELKLPV